MKTQPAQRLATRERLLGAAARVFAREGLARATTRAIAREAGVNEVTLFRHFRTKQRLLDAVVQENFGTPRATAAASLPTHSNDLRADLVAHAHRYEQLLRDNLSLIRAMIGEVQHHGDNERKVFKAIFRPLRKALIDRLEAARREHVLRREVDPVILSDLFGGMVFTGVLRRACSDIHLEYAAADYLDAAVDVIVRGASA